MQIKVIATTLQKAGIQCNIEFVLMIVTMKKGAYKTAQVRNIINNELPVISLQAVPI